MNLHNAPPVVYPLGRSYSHGWLILGLWCAGLLSVVLWFFATQQLNWRMVLAFVAVLVAGIAAQAGWRPTPTGQLLWDGEVWRWERTPYQPGITDYEIFVVVDFQQVMLLRLESRGHARTWLWVERKTMPERWLDLRRAVYGPHKSSDENSNGLLQAEPASAVALSNALPEDISRA